MPKKQQDEAAEKRKLAAKRKREERDRKRAMGLIPKEVWIHNLREKELKELESKLQKPPRKSPKSS